MPVEELAIDDEVHLNDTRAEPSLAAFSVRIHQSLNPKKVVTVAVRELRPILQCDRVCFLERRGQRFRLSAASDQPGVPPRSRQALLLEQFVAAILPTGERFLYPDERTTLSDDLGRLLANYWETSNGQMILVEPVFADTRDADEVTRRPRQRTIVGAIVIEQFISSSLEPETIRRLELAMEHVTPALANANSYWRLAAIPGLYQSGQVFDLVLRTRAIASLLYFLIAAGFVALTCVWQRPFEIECAGRIMPSERREAFAGLEGEVTEVLVDESEHVQLGQVIARLQSRELEKAILEQTGLLNSKLKARDAARADLRSRSTPQARSQSVREQAQFEVVNSEIETIHQQLDLLNREKMQLVIRAPISGTITTDRPRERLLGRPVTRGETLLEVMDESGAWQLELAVPEQKIGHLLTYQEHHPRASVKFRLRSSLQHSFDCAVSRLADRIVPSAGLGSCSTVFCDISKTNLPVRQIGSEVGAKIQCGHRSLLFIWFHEFWELLQRHWWV